MTDMSTSTSLVVRPGKRSGARLSSHHLLRLAFRLSIFRADRWGRRASFYERHRDYFPRLFAGRFVAQCRELESRYRDLAKALFGLSLQDEMVPVRAMASQRRHGKQIARALRLMQ